MSCMNSPCHCAIHLSFYPYITSRPTFPACLVHPIMVVLPPDFMPLLLPYRDFLSQTLVHSEINRIHHPTSQNRHPIINLSVWYKGHTTFLCTFSLRTS